MAGIMMLHMAHRPAAPVVGGDSIRALLSASGQSAYDAASSGNWFSVSAADYAAAAAGIASTSKYVMNDTLVAENGSAWSGTFAQAYPSTISAIPSGVYLYGFISRTQAGGTTTPLISTTFRGTYTSIANSPNAATSGARGYFLRKAPTATAATSYVGLVNSGTGLMGTTTYNVAVGSRGGYDNTIPYSTWVDWTGAYQIFQLLGTTTAVT
jgi:hypothetical protein